MCIRDRRTHIQRAQDAGRIAENVVRALSRTFDIGEQHSFLGASVGIAAYPADGTTAEDLLKNADTAMYRAKAGGRSQAVYFEERMNAEAVARLTLDRDLRQAIERNELVLHYQPQLDLGTGAIRAAEALVRWQHPERGLILPGRFIGIAEESGFIEQIGNWVIRETCAQVRTWPGSYTHLRAHETALDLVCRLLLDKNKETQSVSKAKPDKHT